MEKATIPGPIFLVGVPRSGTKLLREIIINHSMVAIMDAESHDIPKFYRKWSRYGDVREQACFDRFYADFESSRFVQKVRKKYGPIISKDDWFHLLKGASCGETIQIFFQAYAKKQNKQMWGDKTPNYVTKIGMLHEIFPNAKFVHIIRDARDSCLSMKNLNGQSVVTTARRWALKVSSARSAVATTPGIQYKEIYYEHMLDNSEEVIQDLCWFLGIPFEPEMLELKQPTEKRGSKTTIGKRFLVRGNHGKWRTELSEKEVYQIESYCGEVMETHGYSLSNYPPPKKPGLVTEFLYLLRDLGSFTQHLGQHKGKRNILKEMRRRLRRGDKELSL